MQHHMKGDRWAGHLIGEVVGFETDTKEGKEKANSILKAWVKSGALVIENYKDPVTRKTYKIVRSGIPAAS